MAAAAGMLLLGRWPFTSLVARDAGSLQGMDQLRHTQKKVDVQTATRLGLVQHQNIGLLVAQAAALQQEKSALSAGHHMSLNLGLCL